MAKQPNILMIMSDQHHPGVLGCAGNAAARTPALDQLAAGGTRFSATYCPFPLCGPSRMAFLTARHPHRTGVLDNESQLNSDLPTIAHAFTAAGYRTVLSGRMHFVGQDQLHGYLERPIGDVPESVHLSAGWKLGQVLGELRDTPGMARAGILKSGPGNSGYVTYDETVTRCTEELILNHGRSQPNQPFFLTVGYAAPHCPFVCPPEDFAACAPGISPDRLPEPEPEPHERVLNLRRHFGVDPLPPLAARWRVQVAYYGLCRHLDRQIGRLLQALRQSGLAENTIIVYTSDHGESLAEHGLWWKSTFFEASCGIPLILSGPGIAAGVCDQPVSLLDLGPTLLDLAGVPALSGVDGRSLAAACCGAAELTDTPVFAEYIDSGSTGPAQACRMVRSGDWKLHFYAAQGLELFNIATDPGELQNRADDPACWEILESLLALTLKNWEPEAVLSAQQDLANGRRLIGDWVRRACPPEPLPLWFSSPPANHFTAVEPD